MTAEERIAAALAVAHSHGQTDGAHHKAWVIDQMVRALTQDEYEDWVENYESPAEDEDPDDEYEWDEGIAP